MRYKAIMSDEVSFIRIALLSFLRKKEGVTQSFLLKC